MYGCRHVKRTLDDIVAAEKSKVEDIWPGLGALDKNFATRKEGCPLM